MNSIVPWITLIPDTEKQYKNQKALLQFECDIDHEVLHTTVGEITIRALILDVICMVL